MPYEWHDNEGSGAELVLWPYRSLSRKGFVWFIGITAGLLCLPLIALLGSAVLWGLLPFMALIVWGLWHALQSTYRSGETHEVLQLNREVLDLTRRDPGKPDRTWQTNPYWVRPILREGPVEDYLTLTDGKREIELGVFLTPDERRSLHDELLRRLANLR